MNDLQIFKNAEFGEIRTVIIENEPWFVGKEMCIRDSCKNLSLHKVGIQQKKQVALGNLSQ